MTAPGRLAAALVVLAVSIALPFARSPATTSFSAQGLSFRYPAVWRSATFSDVSSFAGSIVYLSATRIRDPCTTVTIRPGVTTKDCGSPIGVLPPGGVFVEWNVYGFPTPHLPKANTTTDGRPSLKTKTSDAAWCIPLGGTEMIMVMIPRSPGTWYQMAACLRPPA